MLINRVTDYGRSRSPELNGKLAKLVAIQLGRPGLNNPSEATTILTQGVNLGFFITIQVSRLKAEG